MARTIAVAVLFFSVTALSAQGPAITDATKVLRISRVILYKTGIGYFEHLGSVTGNQSLAVSFTGDQLDDVLKSLTAVDLGEGRVTGISYDSPTPTDRRLQALRVPLGQKATTLQLLDALRGSQVEIRSGGGIVTGRLLNVERRPRAANERTVDRDEVTLVTAAGEIVTVALDASTRVRLADPDLRQDVGRYLDIAASTSDRSPRRVVLSTAGNGARQILVSYVGEAAVWKTTYRLVFPTAAARQPLLQGWAIVDNVSAADWENVELSLVAGAPQTFRQALSAPLFTTRPVVPLGVNAGLAPQVHAASFVAGTGRVAGVVRDVRGMAIPGAKVTAVAANRGQVAVAITDNAGRYELTSVPSGVVDLRVELAGFNVSMAQGLAISPGGRLGQDFVLSVGSLQETITVTGRTPAVDRPRAAPITEAAAMAPPSRDAIEQRVFGQTIAASGADLGDLFEYRLTDRVTIRRNQSALVPILRATVDAERISLWNDAMGLRPRRAVWLTNTSDLTLDAGSLSVVDSGAFGGEGLIDAVKPGERRLVSFAADLGVHVSARQDETPQRITRVRIASGVVTQDAEDRQRRSYAIRNDDRDPRVVLIEHPARPGWTLARGVTPAESTPTVHRFRVTVPPGQTTTLDVDEVQPGATTYSVNEFHRDRLLVMAGPGNTRAALERAMAPVFAKSLELDGIERELEKRNEEIQTIGADQQRVRDNLAALNRSRDERRLVERYTRQLVSQEDRLDALKREVAAFVEQQSRAAKELGALIASVSIDVTF